ncbi:hypothetical protein [Shewanella algae]|uniref:hypothetical protein n=1 Tax=Shewanella algae TaxID=38313 RepID=UPI0031F579BB
MVEQTLTNERIVPVVLMAIVEGKTKLQSQVYSEDSASCIVVKDQLVQLPLGATQISAPRRGKAIATDNELLSPTLVKADELHLIIVVSAVLQPAISTN